jgi:hypothetical protein
MELEGFHHEKAECIHTDRAPRGLLARHDGQRMNYEINVSVVLPTSAFHGPGL